MDVRPATFGALCACGLEALSNGPESGMSPSVQIGTARHAMPTYMRELAIRHGEDGHEIVASGQDGAAYLIQWDGRWVAMGTVYGRMAGFSASGDPAWQDTARTYRVDGGGVFPLPVPDGASGGFIGDPADVESWPEHWSAHPLTVKGVRLFNPVVCGEWIAGNHPSRTVLLLTRRSTGELWEGGDTLGSPIAPRLTVINGEPVIVRSYPSGLVPLSDMRPYAGEPAPIVRVPTFRPAGRAIGVGSFFASRGPTMAANDPRFPFSSRTPAWFATIGRDDLHAAQREAKAHGVPLGCYYDGHGLNPADVLPGERAWIYCYPGERTSLTQTITRVREDIVRCMDANVPFDLVVATYCQYRFPGVYALTEQQVLDALVVVWDLARAFGAGAVWCFAQERFDHGVLVDGYAHWPNLAEAVRRMQAASSDPNVFPRRESAPPVPKPVPAPEIPPFTPVPVPSPAPVTFFDRARSL